METCDADSAGWSSLEARRAHNPKVIGSNPIPATRLCCTYSFKRMIDVQFSGKPIRVSIREFGHFFLIQFLNP